jgi:hypothetical protein
MFESSQYLIGILTALTGLAFFCGRLFGKIAAYRGAPRCRFKFTPWRRPVCIVSLSLFACATGVHAGQQWEFDGITIAESTAVFERTAISTAGRANPNNQNLNVPGRPDLQLATSHNTLDFMSTNVQPQIAIALAPWRAKELGLDAAGFYFQGFAW